MKILKSWYSALANERGNTLMEALCGLVILTTILVGIYSGFLVAQKTLVVGDIQESDANGAYGALERGEGTGKGGTLRFSLGGETVRFSGEYFEAGQAENGTRLYCFGKPGTLGSAGLANGIKNKYLDFLDEMMAIQKGEKPRPEGYPKYTNNDSMRDWMRENYYGGQWPTLPVHFLEANGIVTTDTLYIQPIWQSGTGDIVVFAKNSQTNSWYCSFVYDPDEEMWYYKKKGGYSVTKSWAEVKKTIHTADWRPLNQ